MGSVARVALAVGDIVWLRGIARNTIEKIGPVRVVRPELVFELGFEAIRRSSRHKSGVAVRFPRMLRWRTDKKIEEATTLAELRAMLPGQVEVPEAPRDRREQQTLF